MGCKIILRVDYTVLNKLSRNHTLPLFLKYNISVSCNESVKYISYSQRDGVKQLI